MRSMAWKRRLAIWLLLGLTILGLAVGAVAAKKTDSTALFDYWLHWLLGLGLVWLFGWMSWQVLPRFLNALDEPDPAKAGFWIESHWGGLGGGLGGWRVSNAIVYLVLLSILGGLVLATATYVVPSLSKNTAGGTEKTGKLSEGGK